MFNKDEMQRELKEFMCGFLVSIERVYAEDAGALIGHPGHSASEVPPADARVESSTLWTTVDAMYDYGVLGLANADMHDRISRGYAIDAQYADMELFLSRIDALGEYMDEDSVVFPTLARRAMRTYVARWVLDGGDRYSGDIGMGELSFAELALLADMDERSVRNAASGSTPSLRSEISGKRALIAVEEARRWLEGRKGFVPTKLVDGAIANRAPVSITVQREIFDRLTDLAVESKLSLEEYLDRLTKEDQKC